MESDVESHRGQVGDVVADLSFGDHAAGVVVGAEVVKSGGGVGKQLPNLLVEIRAREKDAMSHLA